MKYLTNVKIILEDTVLENKGILFDSRILKLADGPVEGADVIDGQGYYVSPGFIDRHIHGVAGFDVMDGTVEALETISKEIVKNGVTNFLPTTMTTDWQTIDKALNAIRDYQGKEAGAAIIGAHLEGPFINERFKGAQRSEAIIRPDFKLIEKHLDIIRQITYASELDEDLGFTKRLLEYKDIHLSIGHSDCSMALALELNEMGVKNITHCFNGMNGLHHRSPGLIGAMFIKDFFAEYIPDGIHSDLRFLRSFIKRLGKEKAVLVTDAMRAAGLKPGLFELGCQKVIVDEQSARLEDGTLAGSILSMNKGVRHMLSDEISLPEVIGMVTVNPAKALGLFDELGTIEAGKWSNLVLFDENINVKEVYIKGEKKYIKV